MRRTLYTAFSLCFLIFSSIGLNAKEHYQTDSLHQDFSAILTENVQDGVVNYTGIGNDPRFHQYLEVLKQTDPDNFESDSEQLAFWINAYNALAIKGIIDGLSPSSFLGRITYFKTTDYEVGDREINLYDLERDIIIPFNEPRIHFAIVCASASCPKLRSEAYTAANLEQQLEENALDFINDKTKNEFNATKKRASVSKIFDWFEKDFEKHSGSVQAYLSRFVNDEQHAQALKNSDYKVKHLKYDWSLNGTLAK